MKRLITLSAVVLGLVMGSTLAQANPFDLNADGYVEENGNVEGVGINYPDFAENAIGINYPDFAENAIGIQYPELP